MRHPKWFSKIKAINNIEKTIFCLKLTYGTTFAYIAKCKRVRCSPLSKAFSKCPFSLMSFFTLMENCVCITHCIQIIRVQWNFTFFEIKKYYKNANSTSLILMGIRIIIIIKELELDEVLR